MEGEVTPAAGAKAPAQSAAKELVERLMRAIPDDGAIEPFAGLRLIRHSAPTPLGHGTSSTAFCVIAEGSKEILLGERRYRYDPAHYLITTAELPIATDDGGVAEATLPERDRHADPALVGAVILETGHLVPWRQSAVLAVDVSPLDATLLDAVLRLVRLVEYADRRPRAGAAHLPRNCLPAPDGRAGWKAAAAGGAERRHSTDRRGGRATAARRPAVAHGDRCARAGHECVELPRALQSGHRDESTAVPKAVAAAGGTAADSGRGP